MKSILFAFTIATFMSCGNTNEIKVDKEGTSENQNQMENKLNDYDSTLLAKTAEMLDENLFWTIVEKSLKSTNSQEGQEQFLINEIGKLGLKEMVGFRLRTDKLLHETYTSEMWCAGYIMNGGCSDDGFEYFRNWVISRGKDVFYAAKKNPDNLVNEFSSKIQVYEFESFWVVANEAFRRKTGKDLYQYVDEAQFKTNEGNYPKIEFNWQEDKPESMKKICPQLFAKMEERR